MHRTKLKKILNLLNHYDKYMEYIKLNLQYTIRNERNCSYIVKLNQQIDPNISSISPRITIIPPFVGYIISQIGKSRIKDSITKIAKKLNVKTESVKEFVNKIEMSRPLILYINSKEIILPQNLLIPSNEIDNRNYVTCEQFNPTNTFIRNRPVNPINITFMITTKCTTNCTYCYAKRNLQNELTLIVTIALYRYQS